MPDLEALVSKGNYQEAAKAIDAELAKKDDAHLYYLRNYEYAHEMLEHAIFVKKEPDCLKLKALILMETAEFADAFEVLKALLSRKKDAEAYFLSAMCLMLLDDMRSREYLQMAYLADKGRTKALIREFYNSFFKDNRFISEKERKALEDRIGAIK